MLKKHLRWQTFVKLFFRQHWFWKTWKIWNYGHLTMAAANLAATSCRRFSYSFAISCARSHVFTTTLEGVMPMAVRSSGCIFPRTVMATTSSLSPKAIPGSFCADRPFHKSAIWWQMHARTITNHLLVYAELRIKRCWHRWQYSRVCCGTEVFGIWYCRCSESCNFQRILAKVVWTRVSLEAHTP